MLLTALCKTVRLGSLLSTFLLFVRAEYKRILHVVRAEYNSDFPLFWVTH